MHKLRTKLNETSLYKFTQVIHRQQRTSTVRVWATLRQNDEHMLASTEQFVKADVLHNDSNHPKTQLNRTPNHRRDDMDINTSKI